jgi:glycosyltransferase involved in cell wall biosynthesis
VSDLKICIFTETFFPVVGGGETQARLLAKGLVDRGHKVMIVTRRSDPSLAKVDRYGDIPVYRLPPIGSQHLKKWGLLLSSFPFLYRSHRGYDIIIVSGFRVIGIAAVIVSILLNKKCLLKADNNGEMSGKFFEGGLEKAGLKFNQPFVKAFLWLRNGILKRADGFVAISSQISEEYMANGVHPPSKIHCIPNSVDTAVFFPVDVKKKNELKQMLGLNQKEILVAYTGRLVSYKGLPELLRVWSRIAGKHPNAGLMLVGGGSLDIYSCEARLKEFVLSNDLEESVFFCGEVHNVHEYLQAADIFVFPTRKEAFGISLIEAMACGLPVIATQVGGLKDILVDGQNGLVVEPGNEEELFSALDALILDRPRAVALGVSALQTVRTRYSTERVTGEYEQLVKSLFMDEFDKNKQ